MMAPEEWLRNTFGKSTIISIASPASNLFSRCHNDEFLFRFALSPQAKAEWESMRQQIQDRHLNRPDCPPAELDAFNSEYSARFKWLMREFKGPGFVNFVYDQLHVGFVGAENKDFAVISLGMNPYSDPNDPRFAILVAGAQYPGTALALRKFAEPKFFEQHPFGGILEADVPRRDLSMKTIQWWDKIENSSTDWHRVSNDPLAYSPSQFSAKLQEWCERISKKSLVPYVTQEEIQRHIGLIDALAAAKARISEGGSANR